MTDLEQLALRCEGAEGPDRELDALIFASTLDLTETRFASIEDWAAQAQRGKWNWPRFTASLDAAMTLVPVHHEWSVNWGGNSSADVSQLPDGPASFGYASTPALALTAAALRARARQTRQPQEGGDAPAAQSRNEGEHGSTQ
jgi:hypothetical protein